jgi:hypothetical protein
MNTVFIDLSLISNMPRTATPFTPSGCRLLQKLSTADEIVIRGYDLVCRKCM